jgi:L-fucose dehydrogenase
MNLHLQNKTILITGGESKTSAAISQALNLEGAIVIRDIASASESIYGIVNCIGESDGVGLEHGDYESFLRSIEANAVHDFSLVQEVLPFLKKSKGCIINIISRVALTGQGNNSGWAAANGIKLGLTTAWADELAPFHIRVNGVVVAEREDLIQDIADATVYLLSSTSAINGELVYIDGGYVHLDRRI